MRPCSDTFFGHGLLPSYSRKRFDSLTEINKIKEQKMNNREKLCYDIPLNISGSPLMFARKATDRTKGMIRSTG